MFRTPIREQIKRPRLIDACMCAEVLNPTAANIALAAAALRAGDVVAMPTETVYGLAGMAFDERAVTRIFACKERPLFDPLICHVQRRQAGSWLEWLSALGLVDPAPLSASARSAVETLANACWPGPLTLVLHKQSQVPDLVTSGLGTVAVRCPQHSVAQQLLAAIELPLAAPSANRFGRISPTSAEHVMAELGSRIPYILDGGTCDVGIESTVLAIGADGELTLLRPGGVSLERLAELVACEIHRPTRQVSFTTSQPAPGLLASHYAPRKPLQLFERPWSTLTTSERKEWLSSLPPQASVGVMLIAGDPEHTAAEMAALASSCQLALRPMSVRSLSNTGDMSEAARKLFGTLRSLDEAAEVDFLWAERVTDATGLGFAINDRLQRAAHK